MPASESPAAANTAAQSAASAISADRMRATIRELSDDKYEGRGPGSRGDVAARQYLAAELEKIGLEPGAADGSWEQPFDLVGVTAEQPDSWTFRSPESELTLKQWDQFIVGSGVQADRAAIDNAEVVFVGYGIQAPEFDWDDYKGMDLNGK
ncbi:MAG: hypothetical protein RLN69_07725, partial [Woeseiaceae bacterium]